MSLETGKTYEIETSGLTLTLKNIAHADVDPKWSMSQYVDAILVRVVREDGEEIPLKHLSVRAKRRILNAVTREMDEGN